MSINFLELKDKYLGITWHKTPTEFPDEIYIFRIDNNEIFFRILDNGFGGISSWFEEHCLGHLGYLLIPLDEFGMESKFSFAFTNLEDLILFKLTWL